MHRTGKYAVWILCLVALAFGLIRQHPPSPRSAKPPTTPAPADVDPDPLPIRSLTRADDSQRDGAALPSTEVDGAGLLRLDQLRRFVRRSARGFEADDRAAVEQAMQEILDRAPEGAGDALLAMMLDDDLSAAESDTCHALLRALLAATLEIAETPRWFEQLDDVVMILLDQVVDSREPWGPFHDLLFTRGLLNETHFDSVGALLAGASGESLATPHFLRVLRDLPLDKSSLATLEELTRSPHPEVRRFAISATLSLEPERVSELTDRIIHGDPVDRRAVFGGICDEVTPNDLPFVLLDLHERGVDIDLTWGLPSYLRRHGGSHFEEVYLLHGEGRDADPYRERAIASINHALAGAPPDLALTEHLLAACLRDPASSVRGTALLGLALCWDHEDRSGFDRFVDRFVGDPDLQPYLANARTNFDSVAQLRKAGVVGSPTIDGEGLVRR